MAEPASPRADQTAKAAYPPAPWELHGQAHVHVLLVAADEVPPCTDGFRPLTVAGHGIAVVGWVDYRDGSVLRYRELLAAVLGRWPFGG